MTSTAQLKFPKNTLGNKRKGLMTFMIFTRYDNFITHIKHELTRQVYITQQCQQNDNPWLGAGTQYFVIAIITNK